MGVNGGVNGGVLSRVLRHEGVNGRVNEGVNGGVNGGVLSRVLRHEIPELRLGQLSLDALDTLAQRVQGALRLLLVAGELGHVPGGEV